MHIALLFLLLTDSWACRQGSIEDINNLYVRINRDRDYQLRDREPVDLKRISPRDKLFFKTGTSRQQFLREEALEHLGAMLAAAERKEVFLHVASSYRSFKRQCTIFVKKYPNDIDSTKTLEIARAGHSEHQLGTTVDLTIRSWHNYQIPKRIVQKNPREILWLIENAHHFGFAMSYPRDPTTGSFQNSITGYIYEPWHWRYIGVEAATKLFTFQYQNFSEHQKLYPKSHFPYISIDEYLQGKIR